MPCRSDSNKSGCQMSKEKKFKYSNNNNNNNNENKKPASKIARAVVALFSTLCAKLSSSNKTTSIN